MTFFITFFTLIDGTSTDSVFGYGFLPGVLALSIWSIATSIATYRAVATSASSPAGPPRAPARRSAGRSRARDQSPV